MGEPIEIGTDWLTDHPLPVHPENTDKNSRGQVLAVGGSRTVPGGVRLTGEAALRAGAGKLQFATVQSLAIPLGIAVSEAGVIPLPEDDDGEIRSQRRRPHPEGRVALRLPGDRSGDDEQKSGW